MSDDIGQIAKSPTVVRLENLLRSAVRTWKSEFPDADPITFEFISLDVQEELHEGKYDAAAYMIHPDDIAELEQTGFVTLKMLDGSEVSLSLDKEG